MTRHFVSSLQELMRTPQHDQPVDWHARLIQRDISGGTQSRSDIDSLGDLPDATALTVSGLDQKSFEHLLDRHGSRFTAIHFWKCPRIFNLSPLESAPQLTHLAFFWNQRATRLWDFSKTPRLVGLHFDDFTRLPKLDDLANAVSLRELGFGNAIWKSYQVATLDPVGELTSLKALIINPRRVLDGRVQPLAKLTQLEVLEFPSNLFTTEQLAWLRARLPESVDGASLSALRKFDRAFPLRGKNIDTLANGYGKPFLDSAVDAKRISKYVAEFELMLSNFRANPNAEPEISVPRKRAASEA